MATEKRLVAKSKLVAIADALRSQTGETGDIKLDAMPAKIAALSMATEEWRECWLEKPRTASNALYIDTGVMADINHKLIYRCSSSASQMSTPFNSCSASGPRYGVNFLPNSNKLQLYWGGYSNTNITIDRGTLDVVQDMLITQSRSGISIAGYTAAGTATTWEQSYTANAGSGSIENYKLFTYARNNQIHYGLFRRAEIQNLSGETICTITPEINNHFVARLKIEQSGVITYVPVPAGFICHLDNEAAA